MAGDKPPSSRFKPGQSGNPKGRPRGKKAKEEPHSAFDVLLDRRVPVVMNGVKRELTLEEALFYRTYQDALAGSRMAIRAVLKKIIEREARRSPSQARSLKVRFEHPDPANVDDALTALGIATPSAERRRPEGGPFMELEPWVVRMALARPQMPRLEDKEVRELKRRTRESSSVVCPEEASCRE